MNFAEMKASLINFYNLKDKINETIEFFLDKEEYHESDRIHIELIKKKLDNLKLCIEKTGKEFNKKSSVKEENNKKKD